MKNVTAGHAKDSFYVQRCQALAGHQDVTQVGDKFGEMVEDVFHDSWFFRVPVFTLRQIIGHVFAQQAHNVGAFLVGQAVVHGAGNDGLDDRRVSRNAGA